jgi:hypothetical protein
MNKRIPTVIASSVLAASAGLAMVSSAYAENLKVEPGVFVGKAGDCGTGYPAGHKIVGAEWVKNIGLPDQHGGDSQALILSKNGPTTDCSAAGADIKGVKGIKLTEIGFDIRNGGHCGSGAPRFNVEATDGSHFVGGCANGTQTPNTPQAGWTRVRINPANPAQAFPPIAPGATIKSISIIFDEGVDTGPDFSGMAIIDNIDINGTLIGQAQGQNPGQGGQEE